MRLCTSADLARRADLRADTKCDAETGERGTGGTREKGHNRRISRIHAACRILEPTALVVDESGTPCRARCIGVTPRDACDRGCK